LPLASSTATPSSCEPPEPTANSRPGCPLKSSATTGGPPLTCVGADVASIATFRAIAGSGLARVMVPFTPKLMRVESPAEVALAESMAARREPGPRSFRLVTTKVRVYAGVWGMEAWATAEPAGKTTAAETPATKPAAPAIRDMSRPVRIIRIFIKPPKWREKISLIPLPSLLPRRIPDFKKYARLSTR